MPTDPDTRRRYWFREKGWRITPHGRVDAGMVTGPCTGGCGAVVVRYGPLGRPQCEDCSRSVVAAP